MTTEPEDANSEREVYGELAEKFAHDLVCGNPEFALKNPTSVMDHAFVLAKAFAARCIDGKRE